MARVAVALSCSAEQRTELINLARSRTGEARLVERAKIVLACLEGKRNDEVSRELGVRPNTVGLWRQRFAARGIARLHDQPRPGKKPKYGEDLRLRILRQLELPAPAGLAGWDGGTLASALGVSDAAVWRVLRKEGIQLRRHRSWCVSTDPQFAAKAAELSACTSTRRRTRWCSASTKSRRSRPWNGPPAMSKPAAVRSFKASKPPTSDTVRSTSLPPWKSPRVHPRQDHTDQEARRFPSPHVRAR